jgi:iron complex outermembrane receptor protein
MSGLSAIAVAVALASQPALAADAAPAAAEQIEEVIVFGHPLVRRAEDLAQPFVVLSGTDLDDRLAGSLGATVAQEPGVQNASFGVAVGRPVIRGQEGARVRTLEDNLDSLDASTVSGDHAVTIEPFAASQIEILKGPASLLYGSGAIGGVVNVITGRIPESLPGEPLSGRAEIRAGGAGDERSASLRLDGAVGSIAWHLDGVKRETDDYDVAGFPRSRAQLLRDALEPPHDDEHGHDDEHEDEEGHEGEDEHDHDHEHEHEHEEGTPPRRGTLGNSSSEVDGYAAGAAWHGDGAFVGVSYGNYRTEYGLPGSAHGDVRIDLEQDRWNIAGAVDDALPGITRLSARMGINRYEHAEIEPSGEIGTLFENEGHDLRLLAEHEEIAGMRGAVGLQLGDRELEASGEEAFVPPSDTETMALFVTEATRIGTMNVQLGARYERVEVTSDGVDDLDFNAFSLSVGAVLPLAEGHSLSVQLDRSARAPVAEELLANGAHIATGAFEVGDPDLEEETATNVSLSYGWSTPRIELIGSVYYTAFDDFIYLADTGEEEDGLPVRNQLQGDATFHGIELETTLHLHEGEGTTFDVALFGDYVRGRLSDGSDTDLPRVAPSRVGVALRGGWNGFAGELALTRVSRQDRVASFELPTDDYLMLDLSLTWHVDIGSSHVEVFARGENLLDEEARNHLSIVKDTAPMQGLGVTGGIRARF